MEYLIGFGIGLCIIAYIAIRAAISAAKNPTVWSVVFGKSR